MASTQYPAEARRAYAQLKKAERKERAANSKLARAERILALVQAKGLITEEELEAALPRRRSKIFVNELVRNRLEGKDPNRAGIVWTERTCLKKYAEQLERPEVCLYALSRFEKAGLTEDEMFAIVAQHIRGIEYETIDDKGRVLKKLPPSAEMLRYGLALILPKQPTKVQAQVALGIGLVGDGPPIFSARELPENRATPDVEADEAT
jgi:hypothetical protein